MSKASNFATSVYAAPTRDYLLKLVDEVERFAGGKELTLALMSVPQTDATIYLTPMTTMMVVAMFCRYPYGDETSSTNGEQQGLALTRVNSIRNRTLDESQFRIEPSNIVVSIKQDAIDGKLIRKRNGTLRGTKYIGLTFDLDAYKERLKAAEVDERGRLTHPEDAMIGFLVDGHHRIEASFEGNMLKFPYPATVYFDKKGEKLSEVYETINKKRGNPNEIMVHAMRELSGKASSAELGAAQILTKIMNEEDSILRGRIRVKGRGVGDDENRLRRYASNDKMLVWIANAIGECIVQLRDTDFSSEDIDAMFETINNYFIAISRVYPRAWDNQNYVLTKAMGIDIMMELLPSVLFLRYRMNSVAAAKEGKSKKKGKDAEKKVAVTTVQDFEETLLKAFFDGDRPKTLTLADRTHPLNWTSKGFGALSGAKGTNQIKDGLRGMIYDELEDLG